jgi:hypothetical protein
VPSDTRRPARATDRSDWDDPDYMFLALVGGDHPGRACLFGRGGRTRRPGLALDLRPSAVCATCSSPSQERSRRASSPIKTPARSSSTTRPCCTDSRNSCRPRRRHHSAHREVRPGRFELPRSKRTTRPSTLRATCPSFPTAAETHILSGTMDDLDLVDSALVVTVLSRELGADPCPSRSVIYTSDESMPRSRNTIGST